MKTHLTDDEFAAAVAGLEIASRAAEHMSSCVSCRQEVAELQRFVAKRRDGIAAESPDWQEQRQAVMAHLADTPTAGCAPARRWLRPLLAAAALLVVAVGVGLLMPPGTAAPPATDNLAVEQILAEVDAVLADDSLPGFESIDPGVEDPASIFENGTS
jgi:anti-sigma factor RsiW